MPFHPQAPPCRPGPRSLSYALSPQYEKSLSFLAKPEWVLCKTFPVWLYFVYLRCKQLFSETFLQPDLGNLPLGVPLMLKPSRQSHTYLPAETLHDKGCSILTTGPAVSRVCVGYLNCAGMKGSHHTFV